MDSPLVAHSKNYVLFLRMLFEPLPNVSRHVTALYGELMLSNKLLSVCVYFMLVCRFIFLIECKLCTLDSHDGCPSKIVLCFPWLPQSQSRGTVGQRDHLYTAQLLH